MKPHDSMRGYFAYYLHEAIGKNKDIVLLTGDLGYKMWDQIRADYPDHFLNCGASEQAMLDIACGLAMAGKIPVVYSITNFLIYRPFETIRTYINHEKLNVKLVGGGRDRDYVHDGISHWSEDVKGILMNLPNIKTYWPSDKSQMKGLVIDLIDNGSPSFISLKR